MLTRAARRLLNKASSWVKKGTFSGALQDLSEAMPKLTPAQPAPIQPTPIQPTPIQPTPVGSRLSAGDLRKLFEGQKINIEGVETPAQAREELARLYRERRPESPYAFFTGLGQGVMPVQQPLMPAQQPLMPVQQPLMPAQQPLSMAPSPGFIQGRAPRFYSEGGSVSRRELDALPGYQAGGLALLPRVLPSERKFMDERLAEYDVYNKGVEGYNTAYDKYVADVDAYNRAAEAYNVGPRTEDFTMAEPVFGGVVPAAPSMAPEQFQAYQEGARRRALNRSSALEEAINRGIVSPDIARILTRGPT